MNSMEPDGTVLDTWLARRYLARPSSDNPRPETDWRQGFSAISPSNITARLVRRTKALSTISAGNVCFACWHHESQFSPCREPVVPAFNTRVLLHDLNSLPQFKTKSPANVRPTITGLKHFHNNCCVFAEDSHFMRDAPHKYSIYMYSPHVSKS